MRRPLLTLVLAALLALVLVLPGAGSASALRAGSDSATVTDKAGDAPPGIDLLSGFYSISNRKAVWSVRVKKLTDTTFLAFESWPLNAGWDRVTVFRENGKTVGRVYFIDNEEETTPYLRKCPGLQVTWKADVGKVRVVVPRGCMQASTPGSDPFEFHTFARFGGQKNGPGDTMPVKKLSP